MKKRHSSSWVEPVGPTGDRESRLWESARTCSMGFLTLCICPPRVKFHSRQKRSAKLPNAVFLHERPLEPRLISPDDVVSSLRGGGNVSRQIVDVLPPSFPADKLVVIEVYTPGGNWSSYPPHKHDTHNPPAEVDLDEIYYFRIAQPEGFALQHLYTGEDIERTNRENARWRRGTGAQRLSRCGCRARV